MIRSPIKRLLIALVGSLVCLSFPGWGQCHVSELFPTHPSHHGFFGRSVSIDDNVIAVGQPATLSEPAVVYVFRYDGSGWNHAESLRPSVIHGHQFAETPQSVSMSGNVVAVGAQLGGSGGAVYVFREDDAEFAEEDILTASDWTPSHFFGHDPAL